MSSINAVREPRTFHPIYTFIHAGHSIVDDNHIVRNFPDFAIDGIRDLQELRRGH
jgi:hypothetical protein